MNNREIELYHEFKYAVAQCISNTDSYHITRIESNYTAQGIPDTNFCYKGFEVWIEFKEGDFELSPLQISWKTRHDTAGGIVAVIRKKGGRYIVEVRDIPKMSFKSMEGIVRLIIEGIHRAKVQKSV